MHALRSLRVGKEKSKGTSERVGLAVGCMHALRCVSAAQHRASKPTFDAIVLSIEIEAKWILLPFWLPRVSIGLRGYFVIFWKRRNDPPSCHPE